MFHIYLTAKETYILLIACFVDNHLNYMKAANDAWNMCIKKYIVDSWLFRVNANKGG